MFTKLFSPIKSLDVRVVLFLITLVLFILGAGAPGAVGI
jgi:hypothetical protein